MKREWKPGDVAVVTMRESRFYGERVMRCDDGERVGWSAQSTDGLTMAFGDKSLRPLVVIDPESREQVERLVEAMGYSLGTGSRVESTQDALRNFLEPPKLDEPTGLGAVVEEHGGRSWVRVTRVGSHPWHSADDDLGPCRAPWSGFDAVRVLSEGMQP